MKKNIVRKGLVVGIIVLFIGLAFIPSFNATSIKKETLVDEDREKIYSTPKLLEFPLHYKDYYDCGIANSGGIYGVDGGAYLFPGFIKSLDTYSDVKGAKGILFHPARNPYQTESLIIGGHWWNPGYWKFALVIGFTGYFLNGNGYGGFSTFHIKGYAAFVRIYYD